MASITYDAQSFQIDGRRIWLSSGTVEHARIPREEWASRIAAARQAGLNTIATSVVWSRHEQRPGTFDFTGDNDLRHFVELVGKAGMWVILRPGPYIGGGWDLGGLPSWLLDLEDVAMRTKSAPFMEACSRYLSAVAQEVKDLQVTSPGEGGPIVLVQNEHQWTCGDDAVGQAYLGELSRYLREAGLTVPAISANDLWQGVEGEIECWSGYENMLADLRQFATVAPDQPRLVSDFRIGRRDVWGEPLPEARGPEEVARKLAEVLSSGGQFNLAPFAGGTSFGFSAGRDPARDEAFGTASADAGAPLNEFGRPGPSYDGVRRVCMFASSFGRVLAGLDPKRHGVVLHPGHAAATGDATGCSVVHVDGAQGSVAFVFASASNKAKGQSTTLLLANGMTLPVELGHLGVVWCMFDVRVTPRTRLDYSNLSAFCSVGTVLVLFGPAGSTGELSINGSPLEVEVPKGKQPLEIEHEGLTLVIASDAQLEQIHPTPEGVLIGVNGVDEEGEPIVAASAKSYTRIAPTGEITKERVKASLARTPSSRGAAKKLALGEWSVATCAEYTTGQSPRFASIDAPASLSALGAPSGYGWYRATFRSSGARRVSTLLPGSGDRLSLTLDGEPIGVVGRGPGAEPGITLGLKKAQHTVVALAESLGRFWGGQHMDEQPGLVDHFWGVKAFKAGKAAVEVGDPIDMLGAISPLWGVAEGETTDSDRLTWTFMHRRKSPLFMTIDAGSVSGLLVLNGEVLRPIGPGGRVTITLDSDLLRSGKNVVQLCVRGELAPIASELASRVSFQEGVESITAKAEWAFAKWETPGDDAFEVVTRKTPVSLGVASWWRTSFMPDDSDAPVALDASGLSKGQLYVNGRHVGRYFVATGAGKAVPPQTLYRIPRSWLIEGEENELLIFDEHGSAPSKIQLLTGTGMTPVSG